MTETIRVNDLSSLTRRGEINFSHIQAISKAGAGNLGESPVKTLHDVMKFMMPLERQHGTTVSFIITLAENS
ncbi:MAG TPA: hypothetical protein VD999_04935 [Vitreimonas sp.]|nr:hypothetical protein [Vitreimonas sp.]